MSIHVTYAGGDRLRIETRGHVLYADQPVPDGGTDTGPTPSELFVAGLGACIAYSAERFLRRHSLSTDGLRVTCAYTWAENPHRVGAIDVAVEAPGLPESRQIAFERVIEHCTVHSSLVSPPDVNVKVSTARPEAA